MPSPPRPALQARQRLISQGLAAEHVHIADATAEGAAEQLRRAFAGRTSLCICTSAVPQVNVAATLASVVGGYTRRALTGLLAWWPWQQPAAGGSAPAAGAGSHISARQGGREASSPASRPRQDAGPPFRLIATWKGGQTPEQVRRASLVQTAVRCLPWGLTPQGDSLLPAWRVHAAPPGAGCTSLSRMGAAP